MVRPETIRVGDELPVFEREGTIHHWNRFAAANDEFATHHWDDEVARQEGFTAAFAMAPLQHSYLHTMLREWMGEAGRIVAVNMKLRSPFTRGHVLRAGGTVAGLRNEGGELFVDLEVWQTDEEGTTLAPGTAIIAFPA